MRPVKRQHDPVDSLGPRCVVRSTNGLKCHRRFDHLEHGGDEHWAVAGGQWYAWKEDDD